MWNVEWMVGEELLDDQTELRCMLGDNTKVRKHKWWELKDEAMRHHKDYNSVAKLKFDIVFISLKNGPLFKVFHVKIINDELSSL